MNAPSPAIWFPTVRTGTGTDVFTERLVRGLRERGIRAEITWLPLRAEYAPWMVSVPQPPDWATIAHVNTWLHTRFLPRGLPVVATIHHAVHHPDAHAYKGALRAAYHRWWIAPNERRVLRRASQNGAVIAVSHFVADTARRTLLDVPMQVIYNGVDTTIFRPGTRERRPDEPFRLLYVGSWKRLKGVDLLAPIMRALGDGFELRYTGGPAAERDKANMPSNMIDIDRLRGDAAVAATMQGVDALLFPSRSEGHPLVAIEAMACGLPTIGTNSTSISEIIDHQKTGFLCPTDDIPSFITTARRLAIDVTLQNHVATTSRCHAISHFSQHTMLDTHIQLYCDIMQQSQ